MHDSQNPDGDSNNSGTDEREVPTAPEVGQGSLTDTEAIIEPPEEPSGDDMVDGQDDAIEPSDSELPPDDTTDMLPPAEPEQPGKLKRFFAGYWRRKWWTVPLTIIVLVGIVMGVPASRYGILGSFMQRTYTVTVVDSTTHTPVSNAKLAFGTTSVVTNSNGVGKVTAKVGDRPLTITKQYYKKYAGTVFVGLSSSGDHRTVDLVATGRQVPVSVINTLTGKHVAGATISVLDTQVKTNASGTATITLPTTAATYTATVTASGYNSATTKVTVTGKVVPSNTFSITPSGRVYYLSNLTGTMNVYSANLDGSNRQVVLTGTGNETASTTNMYHSSDWDYLALITNRTGSDNELYVINTSTGQLTTADSTQGEYSAIGWSGHTFVYELEDSSLQNWQAGMYTLKSYDADTGKTTTLDSSQAVGNSNDFADENISFAPEIIDGKIIYAWAWSSYAPAEYNGKSDQILSINVNGADKTVLKSYSVGSSSPSGYTNFVAYSPSELYVAYGNNTGTTYYVYQNGTLTQSNTLTSSTFWSSYPTYYMSPSGDQTFWSTVRDGKNSLIVGDAGGDNGTTIASLSNYTAVGWYNNNYVLVSKSNELYIMPVSGGKATEIGAFLQ